MKAKIIARCTFWYRVYKYGWRYYSDEKYRKNKSNSIRRIKKYGRKEYNRYVNYKYATKKRILKENPYGRCERCRTWKDRKEITVDHIIPFSKGGKNEKSNIQLLCLECHDIKTQEDLKHEEK